MLVNLSTEHIIDFHRWISNKRAVKYSLSAFTEERDIEWVNSYVKSILSNKNSWEQVISVGGFNIGYCGLSNISSSNNSAEYFILIGDENYWSKGIGTEAGKRVLDYGFNHLSLNRIWLTVSSLNTGAISSYSKLGYKKEGILRNACYRDYAYHDKIVMGILKSEWHNHAIHPTSA
jgi:RimJ/RimL family protein N-acetyltransferase